MPKPHIVMVVPNQITGDSRVQKQAISASKAGFDVTLLGFTQDPQDLEPSIQGDAIFARIPLILEFEHSWRIRRTFRLTRAQHRFDRALQSLSYFKLHKNAVKQHSPQSFSYSKAKNLASRSRSELAINYYRLTTRLLKARRDRVARRVKLGQGKHVPWQSAWPLFADLTSSFAEVVTSLEPDLLHINDAPLLALGEEVKAKLSRIKPNFKYVYDAHEWWPAVPADPAQKQATRILEADFIRRADAVVTVGSILARRLQETYQLPKLPILVENCPPALPQISPGRRTIREEVGIPPESTLIVYSGTIVDRRGVETVLRGIAKHSDVHLALVSGKSINKEVNRLTDLARELGCENRLHVVPYVPATSVTWFLSTADLGVAPFLRSDSHDSALATKISEYVGAGLPLLVSNCTAQAEFVTKHKIGEVFAAGNLPSFQDALNRMLPELATYRDAVTPELQQARSWERQETNLIELYRSLTLEATDPVAAGVDVPSYAATSRFQEAVSTVKPQTLGAKSLDPKFASLPERKRILEEFTANLLSLHRARSETKHP